MKNEKKQKLKHEMINDMKFKGCGARDKTACSW